MNSNSQIEGTFSSLSINNPKLNKILWDNEKHIGTVTVPKGNIWNTLGVFQSGQALIHAEEALFLAENQDFDIIDICSSKKLNSIAEIMLIIKNDCGFMSYKLFNSLKKHGYILMRPECKYFPRSRLFESLRGEYSLFKPSSTFKKTSPSGYIGHVLEVRRDDDIDFIVKKLETINKPAIMALSDEASGFLFLETSLISPLPNQFESNNTQLKQSKCPKPIGI